MPRSVPAPHRRRHHHCNYDGFDKSRTAIGAGASSARTARWWRRSPSAEGAIVAAAASSPWTSRPTRWSSPARRRWRNPTGQPLRLWSATRRRPQHGEGTRQGTAMCGIIGILGKAPVAPLLLEGLKRLEYRGMIRPHRHARERPYRRRRAEGKLVNLAALLDRARLERHGRHRPYLWGRPMDGRTRPMPIPTHETRCRWSITASSRTSRSCATSCRARPRLRNRDRHRDGGPFADPVSRTSKNRRRRRMAAVMARLRGAFASPSSSPTVTI